MEVNAIYKNARISAFKCREVTREIQGRSVAAALDIVALDPTHRQRHLPVRTGIGKCDVSSGSSAVDRHLLAEDRRCVRRWIGLESHDISTFDLARRPSLTPRPLGGQCSRIGGAVA